MEYNVDLCIVGAAGAGMAAAITARQLGIEKVLLLEKQKNPGGCTVMSAGTFGVNTPAQRRQGLFYSPDEMYQDLIQLFNWNCDAKLVRKWINASGENFEWLEGLGLKYNLAVTETADARKFRCTMHRIAEWDGTQWHMRPQGPFLVKALREGCERYGVELLTETRATRLLKDEDGSIAGVEAEGPAGKMRIQAKAVILATGSISNNQELIDRFLDAGEYKDMRVMARVPHNTGDGLIMAEEAGAATGKVSVLFIGPHNHWPNASELTSMLMRRGDNLKVNTRGERFVNESLQTESEYGWMCSVAVDNQPGRVCYTIMDQELVDLTSAGKEHRIPTLVPSLLDAPMIGHGGYRSEDYGVNEWRKHIQEHMEHEQSQGRAKICQTTEEMAEYIGCPHEQLVQTLETYNRSCAKKYDDEFLKPADYLYPVAKAPYYVMRGESGIDTVLGGVKIDSCQRVLRKDGTAIPGLFGAGVMTSGWLSGLYALNGAEMSYTLFSGRNAAVACAEYISERANSQHLKQLD